MEKEYIKELIYVFTCLLLILITWLYLTISFIINARKCPECGKICKIVSKKYRKMTGCTEYTFHKVYCKKCNKEFENKVKTEHCFPE